MQNPDLGPVKQVIVVRKDLNMRKGKIAAQASHASISFMTRGLYRSGDDPLKLSITLDVEAAAWIDGAFTKVVVYVNSEQELLDIYDKALAADCRASIIQDAGHTEFHGVPTYTCVGIGPNLSSKVDKVTGHLPLL